MTPSDVEIIKQILRSDKAVDYMSIDEQKEFIGKCISIVLDRDEAAR